MVNKRKFEGIGASGKEKPVIESYRESEEIVKLPKQDTPESVDKDKIVCDVQKYSGGHPSYSNWTIEAEAWIEENGEVKNKQRMRVGISKKDGKLSDSDVKERVKEEYIKLLNRDPNRGIDDSNRSKAEDVLKSLKDRAPES